MWFTAIKPRKHKKLPLYRVLLRLKHYSISISDRQTSYKSCAHTYNIRARTHTRCCKISTTRPPQLHNTLCACSLRGWSITLTRRFSTTIRPPDPLPLPSQKQSYHNSCQYIICMFWRQTTSLSNVGQDYCIIFDTTCFRYLKKLIFNVEKALV